MSTVQEFTIFWWLVLLYTLLYMPTVSLSNSISFGQMTDSGKEFPSVRALGTAGWIVAPQTSNNALRKTHALQGPIDDAFLDPFILVRPTGVPWNKAVNDQALRTVARFDRLYARFFRAHPRIVDDKDLRPAHLAKYNIVEAGTKK